MYTLDCTVQYAITLCSLNFAVYLNQNSESNIMHDFFSISVIFLKKIHKLIKKTREKGNIVYARRLLQLGLKIITKLFVQCVHCSLQIFSFEFRALFNSWSNWKSFLQSILNTQVSFLIPITLGHSFNHLCNYICNYICKVHFTSFNFWVFCHFFCFRPNLDIFIRTSI